MIGKCTCDEYNGPCQLHSFKFDTPSLSDPYYNFQEVFNDLIGIIKELRNEIDALKEARVTPSILIPTSSKLCVCNRSYPCSTGCGCLKCT